MNTTATRRTFITTLSAGIIATATALRADEKALQPGLDELRQWFEEGAPLAGIGNQFLLDPKIAYLNTGSVGACPRVVVETHSAFLRALEADPTHTVFGSMGQQMEEARKKAAAFLGADAEEVTLTDNTTSGMNLVADALKLQPGDEILTSTQEHAGGLIGWQHTAERQGAVVKQIALPTPAKSSEEVVAAVRAGITPRTKVISLSHVNTITGLRLPVAAISKLAAESGAFLVIDGAQAPGMFPVNVHELGCDAYALSCHKWMLGPKGCGLLYLRKSFAEKVPAVALRSGPGAYTAATGTRNVPQFLALGVALDVLQAIGLDHIETHDLSLANYLIEQVNNLPNFEVASSPVRELQSAMTAIKLPTNHTAPQTAAKLLEKGITVKVVPGDHLENRGLRISTHLYNNRGDVDRLVRELKSLL